MQATQQMVLGFSHRCRCLYVPRRSNAWRTRRLVNLSRRVDKTSETLRRSPPPPLRRRPRRRRAGSATYRRDPAHVKATRGHFQHRPAVQAPLPAPHHNCGRHERTVADQASRIPVGMFPRDVLRCNYDAIDEILVLTGNSPQVGMQDVTGGSKGAGQSGIPPQKNTQNQVKMNRFRRVEDKRRNLYEGKLMLNATVTHKPSKSDEFLEIIFFLHLAPQTDSLDPPLQDAI